MTVGLVPYRKLFGWRINNGELRFDGIWFVIVRFGNALWFVRPALWLFGCRLSLIARSLETSSEEVAFGDFTPFIFVTTTGLLEFVIKDNLSSCLSLLSLRLGLPVDALNWMLLLMPFAGGGTLSFDRLWLHGSMIRKLLRNLALLTKTTYALTLNSLHWIIHTGTMARKRTSLRLMISHLLSVRNENTLNAAKKMRDFKQI